MTGNRNANRGN